MIQSIGQLRLFFVCGVGTWALLISSAWAQVNGPGPSLSSTFDTVLNLPGDEAVITGADDESIGGVSGETNQLNVNSGGGVGVSFTINSGSEVNISGGMLGRLSESRSGSEVNISGGILGDSFSAFAGSVVSINGGAVCAGFDALSGSEVSISGGAIANSFEAHPGSNVELIGGEFRLNGADFTGGTISLAEGDVFTGTFADGSSFIFGEDQFDDLNDVALTVVKLPQIDTTPIVLNAPLVDGPSGLRAGQELTLVEGGSLGDSFSVVGATLNLKGGNLGMGAQVHEGLVEINGGTVGAGEIFGGLFDALAGSVVNISGGDMNGNFDALWGSVVNISGGNLGGNFEAFSGSEVNISGGTMASGFTVFPGSDVELIGGEFRLNGANFTGSTISITEDDVFTGTLADGSSFIFSNLDSDELNDASLTVVDLPPVDTNPIVVNTPIVTGPTGLRAGQELTLVAGGSLGDDFSLVDATLNVEGGNVGGGAEAYNSIVNISGGSVWIGLTAFSGSEINISGGSVSGGLGANLGSVLEISGGTLGTIFANAGSAVNISGSAFSIDGSPLPNLEPSEPVTINDRNVVLSGLLADGKPFSFDLNSNFDFFEDSFAPDATLTVTLAVPFLLGDCNQNGVVNFQDISPFIAILASLSFLDQADCNQDGVVNFQDIQPLIQILANS